MHYTVDTFYIVKCKIQSYSMTLDFTSEAKNRRAT